MITQLEITSSTGVVLILPLQDQSNGFIVQDITGLDPVAATIVSSSFAQLDGEQFQSSKRVKRNIVLTLGYDPDYISSTVRVLRAQLYAFFMPKSSIVMVFRDDEGPDLTINGMVETFVAPLFAKDPNATISILNFDPDFIDPTVNTVSGFTTQGTDEVEIDYAGTVDTGILFTLNVDRVMSNFTLYNRTSEGTQNAQFIADLAIADILEINTQPGNKSILNTSGGTESSLLYGLSPYAAWITLEPGQNFFRVLVDSAGTPYTITYTDRYGGL